MLETISLPILAKAIDFLFGECSKILKERRERRQKETSQLAVPVSASALAEPAQQPPAIQTKAIALETKISQGLWLGSQSQVEHLTGLLEIHLRNYQLVSKQCALWGEALMPAILVNNLHHEEKEIAKITGELQQLLSKLYEKKFVAIPDEQFYE